MRTSWKVVSVAVLLVLGVSLGYGWGNATHVWFAKSLSVGPGTGLMQNEMYGAVLPDLFGYEFTNARAMAADYGLHTSAELFWALYGSAVSQEAKACFYGMFTHSNAQEIMGADWYAHGVYPIPGQAPDPNGWVIIQGNKLVTHPLISRYIAELVGDFSPYFLPVVGHTLIETAVDILVKRNDDPDVGSELLVAAEYRSDEVPVVLANVLAKADNAFPHVRYTLERESAYREEMMQYGQLFQMKESDVIAVLSQQTAVLAQAYLQVAGVTPSAPIDPAKIAKFIRIAIEQVYPIYQGELTYTLNSVRTNLSSIGLPPFESVIANGGKGSAQTELAGAQSAKPTEFALDQNYPNPFNPTTTITFALPSDQIVSLKVYNAIGQEVATLVNEFKTTGRYSALWDAKGVPSGVYFYRLQAGNVVDTRKMTLLK